MTPRLVGEHAGDACAKKAGLDVAEVADCMASFLYARGPTTGELLVNLAKQCGHLPHDDRAFGPVFARLAREGRIECVGYCDRSKGHGTAGGRIWQIKSVNIERKAA